MRRSSVYGPKIRTSLAAMTPYKLGVGYTLPSWINHIPLGSSLYALGSPSFLGSGAVRSSLTVRRCTTNMRGGWAWPITYSNPSVYLNSSLLFSFSSPHAGTGCSSKMAYIFSKACPYMYPSAAAWTCRCVRSLPLLDWGSKNGDRAK